MGNIVSSVYDDRREIFHITYLSWCMDGPAIQRSTDIQYGTLSGAYMNGKRISWDKFRDIFKYYDQWSAITDFEVTPVNGGVKIKFKLKEENEMTKRDMAYISRLEERVEELERKRQYWIEKYESEHKRAISLDKKYNEYKKGWNEARDFIDTIRHRLHIDDKEPDSYILDRLRSITESRDSWEEECCKWREEARRVRGELKLPLSADTDWVVGEIRKIKIDNTNYALNRMNTKYMVDCERLKSFKQELGDILGVSKEASYPEFVRATRDLLSLKNSLTHALEEKVDYICELRGMNREQAKHNGNLIKRLHDECEECRKLRDLLESNNRRNNEAIVLNDDIWMEIANIWAICCDTDMNNAAGLDSFDLLSDIFEFCDRATTAMGNFEENRKLIVDLYESIIGEKAGSKASVMLIGEIVRKLETWEKDRDEQKQLLSERAREAEKKLSVISKIVGADRNHYKY